MWGKWQGASGQEKRDENVVPFVSKNYVGVLLLADIKFKLSGCIFIHLGIMESIYHLAALHTDIFIYLGALNPGSCMH